MIKKKGFTLIELIVAMAILAIAFLGVSSAIKGGSEISATTKKKDYCVIYAQDILQTYKTSGKAVIRAIYETPSVANPGGVPATKKVNFSTYFYFNDDKELMDILKANKYTEKTESDFDEKKELSGEQYGALVQFETGTIVGKKIDSTHAVVGNNIDLNKGLENVKIRIKVVNYKDNYKGKSEIVYYLCR